MKPEGQSDMPPRQSSSPLPAANRIRRNPACRHPPMKEAPKPTAHVSWTPSPQHSSNPHSIQEPKAWREHPLRNARPAGQKMALNPNMCERTVHKQSGSWTSTSTWLNSSQSLSSAGRAESLLRHVLLAITSRQQ